MSVLNSSNMFNNQLNSFNSGHIRSNSYNELVNKFKNGVPSSKIPSPSQGNSSNGFHYIKKRSYSDLLREGSGSDDKGLLKNGANKRSRTAPPSPPSQPCDSNINLGHIPQIKFHKVQENGNLRSRSLSPNKKFVNCISPSNTPSFPNTPSSSPKKKPTLPSISTVFDAAPMAKRLKPITPTVSLDYFDTYKPNDANWRYGLLDTINKGSKPFNIGQYEYLNKHKLSTVPSSAYMSTRPSFDSKISSKIINNSSPKTYSKSNYPPCIQEKVHSERKINFPYESNYTYLNKTYLNDVQRYPEYLELAQSLIQLSKPQSYIPQVSQCQPMTPVNMNKDATGVLVAPSEAYSQNSETPYPSTPPSSAHIPNVKYNRPNPNGSFLNIISEGPSTPPSEVQTSAFIPVTPPSSKSKTKTEALKVSPKHTHVPRVCISCGSDQSPCWRPSWSIKEGQLCNSCGLRYKKTSARCLNDECKKIPAKGEWSLMQSKGKSLFEDGVEGHSCLDCGWRVEVKK